MLILLLLANSEQPTGGAQKAVPEQNTILCTVLTCSTQLSAEQMFQLAEDLLKQNDYKQAVILLESLTKDSNADYRSEARVRLARIYTVLGENQKAASLYQQLLDEKPDAARARIELSNLLLKMGDTEAAGRQLRRAAAVNGLPQEVYDALGRMSNALYNEKPLSGSFEIGIAPDTNINRATQATQLDLFGLPFQLDDNGRSTSGVGLTFRANAVAKTKFEKGSRLVAQMSISGDLYKKSQFNDINLMGNIGPEIVSNKDFFRPSIVLGRRWFGSDTLYDLYGLSLFYRKPVSKKSQLSVTLGLTHLNYAKRNDQSGNIYSAGLGYEYAFSPQLAMRIGINGSSVDTNSPSNRSYSIGTDATLSRDVGRFTIFGRGAYSYTGASFNYAPFPAKRNDNMYEGQGGIIFRQFSFMGFSPQITATHSVNNSPITLLEYKRTRYEFSAVSRF